MPIVNLFAIGDGASEDGMEIDLVTDDYCNVLVQLLPQGRIWNLKAEGTLRSLLCALGVEPSRIEKRVADLIEESDPRTTQEMLEQWEALFDLSPADGATLSERQQQLAAAVTRRGSDSEPFFLDLAAQLGFPNAEIVRWHDPFTAVSPCTHGLYGADGGWTYHWTFVLHGSNENNAALQEFVLKYAQAHTTVDFDFTTP